MIARFAILLLLILLSSCSGNSAVSVSELGEECAIVCSRNDDKQKAISLFAIPRQTVKLSKRTVNYSAQSAPRCVRAVSLTSKIAARLCPASIKVQESKYVLFLSHLHSLRFFIYFYCQMRN